MLADAMYQRQEVEKLLQSGDIEPRDQAAIRIKIMELDYKYGMRTLASLKSPEKQSADLAFEVVIEPEKEVSNGSDTDA
jgi:hypothetical protein